MKTNRFAGLVVAAVAALVLYVPAAGAAITPVPNSTAGATTVAHAAARTPATVTGASFVAHTVEGTPNGTADAPFNEFPTHGSTFSILTTGDVTLADDPNDDEATGVNNEGGNARGNTDYDVTILKIDLSVPQGVNCLSFDFKFFSEEYPEFVQAGYNDAFIAELDTSTWTTSGQTVSAPNNFATDPAGNPITIDSTGYASVSTAEAAGTTYDAATDLIAAATPVTVGAHSLYLSIFDQGDQIYDSAVFFDNIRFTTVSNPQTECKTGPAPPTAVKLQSFSARASARGATLRWTGPASGTLGFNVYREQNGRRIKVNGGLVPAAGFSGSASYSWIDRKGKVGTRYWLQEVSLTGSKRWLAATIATRT